MSVPHVPAVGGQECPSHTFRQLADKNVRPTRSGSWRTGMSAPHLGVLDVALFASGADVDQGEGHSVAGFVGFDGDGVLVIFGASF